LLIFSKCLYSTEKKAAIQLAFIATTFLIGYLPLTIYLMWSTRVASKDLL